ncbi:MAG: hypothetical protein EOO38_10025, partial [Cytophagaceae bacterium]
MGAVDYGILALYFVFVLGIGWSLKRHMKTSAEVGGEEGEARDPGGDGAGGAEELGAGLHMTLERPPDAEHEDEVEREDPVVHG